MEAPVATPKAIGGLNDMPEIARHTSTCPSGLRAFNGEGNVVRLACDQWKCDSCRHILSWRWAKRVQLGIDGHSGASYHQVFTLPGQIRTQAYGFLILRGCWDNYRKFMQRALGKWGYAAFVELHPRRAGIAHFHVISLEKCPQRISDMAAHAGFGWRTWEKLVDGKGAAREVSKYTSKQGANMPKGFRRVRLSRGWPKLPDPTYDLPIYVKARSEQFDHYFHRIHALTGSDIPDLLARWEHSEYDL
jgi:hypothetical protein